MNLFELRGTSIITERKINDISTIKSKMESRLNNLKARTIINENVIEFKTIQIILGTGYINTNPILLRLYKEGNIVIDKQSRSLKITWTVKLDSLYFLALCWSIVAGTVVSLYVNTGLVISVCNGILFFLMFVFIGIVLIKIQLDNLINSSVYRNY